MFVFKVATMHKTPLVVSYLEDWICILKMHTYTVLDILAVIEQKFGRKPNIENVQQGFLKYCMGSIDVKCEIKQIELFQVDNPANNLKLIQHQ